MWNIELEVYGVLSGSCELIRNIESFIYIRMFT